MCVDEFLVHRMRESDVNSVNIAIRILLNLLQSIDVNLPRIVEHASKSIAIPISHMIRDYLPLRQSP